MVDCIYYYLLGSQRKLGGNGVKAILLIMIVLLSTTGLFLNSCITITPDTPIPEADQDSTQTPASSPESSPPPEPGQSSVLSPCPSGVSPSKVEYYNPREQGWQWKPSITISAEANDPRIEQVREGVRYWNQHFADMGTPFRLVNVIHTTDLVPDDYLVAFSKSIGDKSPRPELPDSVKEISGDIIIALSDANFISFTQSLQNHPCIIGIRNCEHPPLSLTNVSLNVITHEMGHSIGLGHNNDPTKLMCGRPADSSPEDYHCDHEQIFQITVIF